jgi:hypothetical protein
VRPGETRGNGRLLEFPGSLYATSLYPGYRQSSLFLTPPNALLGPPVRAPRSIGQCCVSFDALGFRPDGGLLLFATLRESKNNWTGKHGLAAENEICAFGESITRPRPITQPPPSHFSIQYHPHPHPNIANPLCSLSSPTHSYTSTPRRDTIEAAKRLAFAPS